jgi:hypothetical protein
VNDKDEIKIVSMIVFVLMLLFAGIFWYVATLGAQLQAVLHKHGW